MPLGNYLEAVQGDMRRFQGVDAPDAVRAYSKPTLGATLGFALCYHAQIMACFALWLLLPSSWPAALLACAYAALLLMCGRAYRGLEGMMHEASHRRWHAARRINDFLGKWFTAYVLGKALVGYRREHVDHHAHLFSPTLDEDFAHYESMRYRTLRRSGYLRLFCDVVARYPRLLGKFARNFLSSREVMLGWTLAMLTLSGCVALAAGAAAAAQYFLLFYLAPYLLVTTGLRILGEAEEHVYDDSGRRGIIETTVNNQGWFQSFFVHPGGDNYHVIHHLFPSVLQVHQPAVHKLLWKSGGEYRERVLNRRSLLDAPRALRAATAGGAGAEALMEHAG